MSCARPDQLASSIIPQDTKYQNKSCTATGNVTIRQRPYCVEYTGSHPNSEVKRRQARIVLGWGTSREVQGAIGFFHIELI